MARPDRKDARGGPGPAPGLGALAEGMAEAALLLAVATVPLFFNVHAARPFETMKIALLWVLGAMAATALLARALVSPRPSLGPRALGVAIAAWLVALAVATLGSIAPGDSLWGSYHRGEGLVTHACYAALLGAALLVLRRPDALRRLVDVAIVSSGIAATYAVAQALGLDPLPAAPTDERPFSTVGNAIGLSAYLALVLPLVGARLWAAATRPNLPLAEIGALVLLALVDVVAMVASGSRGPVAGLLAGLLMAGLAAAVLARRKTAVLVFVAVAIAAVLGGTVLGALAFRRGAHREARQGGAVTDLARHASSSVRLEVWRGAVNAAGENARTLLIGHGPDTLRLAFQPFFPPRLARLESWSARPDRSHNETLDALVHAGVPGALAQLGLAASILYAALAALGLLGAPGDRRRLLALMGALPLVAVLGTRAVDGGFRLLGVAATGGLFGALFVHLLLLGLSDFEPAPAAPGHTPPRSSALALALLACVVAHIAETQVAFGLSSTLVLFWALVGALLGTRAPEADANATVAAGGARRAWASGVGVGAALAAVAFSFAWTQRGGNTVAALLGAAGVVIALGAILNGGGWRHALAAAFAAAITLGAFFACRGALLPPKGLADPSTVTDAWLAFMALACVAAGMLGTGRTAWRHLGGQGVLGAAGMLGVLVLTALLVRRPLWADVMFQAGHNAVMRAQTKVGLDLERRALDLTPRNAVQRGLHASMLARIAAVAQGAARTRFFDDAEAAFARALATAPLDPDILEQAATVQASRAELEAGTPTADAAVERAAAAYARATARLPTNARLWAGACNVFVRAKRWYDALDPCRRAHELDPTIDTANELLAETLRALGRYQDLVDLLEDTTPRRSRSARAWIQLANAQLSARRPAEARRTLEHALTTVPPEEAPRVRKRLAEMATP